MDEELTARARRGDMAAFTALVQLHTPGLWHFLRVRAPDAALAADLVQETFLRAWRCMGEFRGECTFRSWLYRIALRLLINEQQKQRRLVVTDRVPEQADLAADAGGEQLELAAEHADLTVALATLSPEEQELVRLVYQDRLSYAEVSTLLEIPLGTVKIRLHRARERLRHQLEAAWEVCT